MSDAIPRKQRFALLFLISGLIAGADQLTKALIAKSFALYQTVDVIPGFFSLTHIRNTGAAFGFLSGQSTGIRPLFFLALSLAALAVILALYVRIAADKRWVAVALAAIFGGAVGNLIDRLRFGAVIDFLDFYVGSLHWPAFNVADAAISVGVGTLCVFVVLKKV